MNKKFILLSVVFLLVVGAGFAQSKPQQTMINGKVSLGKYHEREELDRMQKGPLLKLYVERIEIIIKILPNIAFATKPGVTMASLGIPETKEHLKALKTQKEATSTYFDSTLEFQQKILPYSDKSNLVSAILFYEETLKSLHTYNEFN